MSIWWHFDPWACNCWSSLLPPSKHGPSLAWSCHFTSLTQQTRQRCYMGSPETLMWQLPSLNWKMRRMRAMQRMRNPRSVMWTQYHDIHVISHDYLVMAIWHVIFVWPWFSLQKKKLKKDHLASENHSECCDCLIKNSAYIVINVLKLFDSFTVTFLISISGKKGKVVSSPNAPPLNRIPLPKLWVFWRRESYSVSCEMSILLIHMKSPELLRCHTCLVNTWTLQVHNSAH